MATLSLLFSRSPPAVVSAGGAEEIFELRISRKRLPSSLFFVLAREFALFLTPTAAPWLQNFRDKGFAYPLPAFSEDEAATMVQNFRRLDDEMQKVAPHGSTTLCGTRRSCSGSR